MLSIFKDQFDCSIFRRNIFKLILEHSIDERKIRAKIESTPEQADWMVCFTTFSHQNIQALERLNFSLMSIRVTYRFAGIISVPSQPTPHGISLSLLSKQKKLNLSEKSIIALAKIIGSTSHYFQNNEISKKDVVLFYQTWIKNSLFKDYADEAVLLTKGPELVGLLTIKVKNQVGYIDLVGVDAKIQGKGLGTLLMREALAYFKRKKIKSIKVTTQGENIRANNFYQKNHFIIEKTELVYHLIVKSL
jgi:GNAT superfamily N-acetyltransferase